MTDLVAIVRATRKSALAVGRMQHLTFQMREARDAEKALLLRKHSVAHRAYQAAQVVLRANPLPGDKS